MKQLQAPADALPLPGPTPKVDVPKGNAESSPPLQVAFHMLWIDGGTPATGQYALHPLLVLHSMGVKYA